MFRTAQLVFRETKRVVGTTPTWAEGLIASSFSTSSNSSQKLAGKVAVITGAASGIGKATAAEFIKNGAKVILADVQDDLGHAVAAELGPDATYTRCDVADESHVAAAVDLAVARHGRLDVFHSNAGICGTIPQDDMASLDLANFDRLMAVNARAVVAGIKHAARAMAPRRAGVVLVTSSGAGVTSVSNIPLYSISKAAAIAAVRATAEPMARHGLRVNAISPGGVRTPLMARVFADMMPGASEETLRMVTEREDMMEPEFIARAALYLASDDAKFVNGHNLVVDSGYSVYKGAGTPAR